MAWMNIGDNNATLPTAGGTNGECVVGTSKQSVSTILFSKSGQTTVRQRETETITEYRALDEASALAKVGVTDATTQTSYYATFGEEDHSITVTTGTKTEVSARRANEANGWIVTKSEVAYTVEGLDTSTWKTTRVVSGGGTSRTVSVNVSSTHVRTYSGVALYSTKKVTVTEYPGLSQSEAEAKATALANQTNVAEKVMICLAQSFIDGRWFTGSWAWASLHTGTIVYASTRKVSDEEGYVVTATEEVYGWRQAGQVDDQTTRKFWSVDS